jgi:hypothetical protein
VVLSIMEPVDLVGHSDDQEIPGPCEARATAPEVNNSPGVKVWRVSDTRNRRCLCIMCSLFRET